jgi:hypothetical protein
VLVDVVTEDVVEVLEVLVCGCDRRCLGGNRGLPGGDAQYTPTKIEK